MMATGDGLVASRYRLVAPLGQGGMGVVWRAYDERLHRTIALKQLRLPAGLSTPEVEEATRRAMREGRIAARLQHQNSIMVYDVVEDAGQPYLIMEYLPSKSLSEVLTERGPLAPAEVARIGSSTAAALASAHAAGVVHRDVKPGNILLGDNGAVKITDFGISRAIEDATLTRSGLITGTPAYLSPEVAKGERATFASDVFSLGATLYTATEGEPPFGTSDNPMALLFRIASGEARRPTTAGPLAPVLDRLLEPDPAARPTMTQVRDVLAAVAGGAAVPPGWQPAPEPPTPPTAQDAGPAGAATTIDLGGSAPAPTRRDTAAGAVPAGGGMPVLGGGMPVAGGVSAGGRPRPPDHRPRPAVLVTVAVALLAIGAVLLALGTGAIGRRSDGTSTSASGSQPAATTAPTSVPTSAAVSSNNQGGPGSNGQGGGNNGNGGGSGNGATAQPNHGGPPDRAAFITDYYGLLPANTTVGWTRLTARYQQGTAHGFDSYLRFWGQMSAVRAYDALAQGDTVDATVEYTFKDGRVVVERHRYSLVQDGGVWKIDASTVLSSRTR